MSERGLEFANSWIADNIRPGLFLTEEEDSPDTRDAVRQLIEEATEEGISRDEIEEDVGDLADYVRSALEEAADAELDRLIDDDE
ncbi:MAG TPA: hypothetical protein VN152_06045 [Sphingopyxis sp.]|jgi:hypothetical protein|nr:hypothetical protein [Sphingopyxis sp.]